MTDIDPLTNTSAVRVGDWKLVLGEQPYSGWIPPPTIETNSSIYFDATNGTIFIAHHVHTMIRKDIFLTFILTRYICLSFQYNGRSY